MKVQPRGFKPWTSGLSSQHYTNKLKIILICNYENPELVLMIWITHIRGYLNVNIWKTSLPPISERQSFSYVNHLQLCNDIHLDFLHLKDQDWNLNKKRNEILSRCGWDESILTYSRKENSTCSHEICKLVQNL